MKNTSVKRLRGPAILLLALILLSSCGTAGAIGQKDIDRINRNEQQFNNDMHGSWIGTRAGY